MHPQHSSDVSNAPAPSRKRDPQEIYEGEQRGLLALLLAEFPGVLTYREALTARVTDPDDLIEADDFADVARGLVAAGLVIRQGELMMPSRPAREMVGLGFVLG
jgi:hypothetical protein